MSAFVKRIDQPLGSLLAPLPGLALGMVVLRLAELHALHPSGDEWLGMFFRMVCQDALSLLSGLLLWSLLGWPLLWLRSESGRRLAWGLLGSLVLLTEAGLIHYFSVSGVPLGADLFAYSTTEVATTVAGARASVPLALLFALLIGLFLFWGFLWWLPRPSPWRLPSGASTALLALGLVSWGTLPSPWPLTTSDAERNKLGYWSADVLTKSLSRWKAPAVSPTFADPLYPFARSETTPDTLSPLFQWQGQAKPNWIIVIVEGLGRSFSGPGARLGSFTPFLDELSKRSLYWENFVATQGRTFAVLPSILGSLPQGFHAYPEIAHDSLPSLLQSEGYALRYFTGTNLAFDRQGEYLAAAGVKFQFSERDFQRPERRLTEWGYADGDLLEAVGAHVQKEIATPYLTVVQTMSMHTPFVVPELDDYRRRVTNHLDRLGIVGEARASYLRQQDTYASILYTDDALRRLFDQLAQAPSWPNTVVLITGDHRLPEIPMVTRLERYHVPLIVASPMLRNPQTIRAVSSHFDIAPSLLAVLSSQFGVRTPSTVSWLGAGLDPGTVFRNNHAFPLQQTKTELSDYISGTYYLGQGQLYRLSENLQPEPTEDAAVKASMLAELEVFRSTNAALATARRMIPESIQDKRIAYDATQRTLDRRIRKHTPQGIVVSAAKARLNPQGGVKIEATFTNHAQKASPVFVPLLAVTDAQGKQLAEVSGKAVQLAAGESATYALALSMPQGLLMTGHHFASFIVSHPGTGKPIGQGQYHVALEN